MRALLAAATLAVVAWMNGCGPQPPRQLETWSWGWRVPLPPRAPPEAATIETILYAGGTVRELRLDLTVTGLAGDLAEIRFLAVDRSDLGVRRAADLPADGHLVFDAGARSAVRLRISTPAGVAWPSVTVNAVTVREATTEPDRGALVVTPGETIDTVFASPQRALFLRVEQLGERSVDLVAFGAGDLLVGDPTTTDYWLTASQAWAVLGNGLDAGPGVGVGAVVGSQRRQLARMARFTAAELAGRSALRVTWAPPDAAALTLPPEQGHARIVVREVADLKLAFPSPTPAEFFGAWFGVDRDGSEAPPRACAPSTPPLGAPRADALDVPYQRCLVNAQLDKLACTDWNGRGGLVDAPGGVRLPAAPVRCYDTHAGTDFGLRGGTLAQAAGVEVTAAAAGVVLATDDGHTDDCFFNPFAGDIGCADVQYKRAFWDELAPGAGQPANFIAIRQDDGLIALYYHLRQGSVAVTPGQSVRCGQHLAQVGSSGRSSGPHLHYELRAMTGRDVAFEDYDTFDDVTTTVDPFPDRWVSWTDGAPPSPTCP